MTPEAKAVQFNRLMKRAALAWERGNNSGDSATLAKGEAQCDRLRAEAERLLPAGATVYYPGLYPVVTLHGREHYSVTARLWEPAPCRY